MMKKVILAMTMLAVLGTATAQQIELKGVVLGQKDQPETTITTLGGVEGAILTSSLKDGTVYALYFTPSKDGKNVDRIYSTEAEKLLTGVQKKFGFKRWRKSYESDYSKDEYTAFAETEGASFMAKFDKNKYKEPPVEFWLYIYDPALKAIAEKEEQAEADQDF